MLGARLGHRKWSIYHAFIFLVQNLAKGIVPMLFLEFGVEDWLHQMISMQFGHFQHSHNEDSREKPQK
jgi:hypothetical protein